jgi:protein O-mannosyl-transferase
VKTAAPGIGAHPSSLPGLGPRFSRALPIVVLLAVLGAVLATHWTALAAAATYMDDKYYLGGEMRHPSWATVKAILGDVWSPSLVNGYYQPLSMGSVMLDFLDPKAATSLLPFHRTTLLLHLINVTLVVVLLRRLCASWPVAGLLGLLYGVHPLNVDVVVWIAERKTVLSTAFALGALVLYVSYAQHAARVPRGDGKRYGAALLLYTCALLAKPTAMPVVAWLLILDYWPLGRLRRRTLWEKVPFLVVGLLAAAVTMVSQAQAGQGGETQMMKPQHLPWVVGYCIGFYLWKTVYPANLVSDYLAPSPFALTNPDVLMGVVGTVILATAIVLSVRRTRAWLAGGLLFFTAILPTLGIIRYTPSIAANRSMYLPMVGLLLPAAWGVGRLLSLQVGPRRTSLVRAMVGGVGVLLVVLSVGATRRYEAQWRDSLTLLRYYLARSPHSTMLHTRMGNEWVARGEHARASEEFRAATRLSPGWTENHLNLGRALFTVGEKTEADAGAAAARGLFEQAGEAFSVALAQTPNDWRAHMLMGMTLARLQARQDALLRFRAAAQLAPTKAEPHLQLGNVLAELGRADEARAEYAQALRLNPRLAGAKQALDALSGRTQQ